MRDAAATADDLEILRSASPGVETAVDQIEEWAAILALQLGVGQTAKLLRRLAAEVEALPAATVQ